MEKVTSNMYLHGFINGVVVAKQKIKDVIQNPKSFIKFNVVTDYQLSIWRRKFASYHEMRVLSSDTFKFVLIDLAWGS